MAKNNSISNGEILHHVAIRIRVTGTGSLRTSLHSLDDVNSQTLFPLTMIASTNREETILANYTDQYGQIEVKTTGIDEIFNIDRIIFFVKPDAAEYPR